MFRCKGRDSFVGKFFTRCAHGISDGENTRVENANNISGIRLFYDMAILCHHLLWLGKSHLFIALYMVDFHSGIEFAGADTHKCDSVSVGFVHVCLNLKDKRGKFFRHRIDHATVCGSWQR